MITVIIQAESGEQRQLTLYEQEAKRIAQILSSHAEEWKSQGDLKAAVLGDLLIETTQK